MLLSSRWTYDRVGDTLPAAFTFVQKCDEQSPLWMMTMQPRYRNIGRYSNNRVVRFYCNWRLRKTQSNLTPTKQAGTVVWHHLQHSGPCYIGSVKMGGICKDYIDNTTGLLPDFTLVVDRLKGIQTSIAPITTPL